MICGPFRAKKLKSKMAASPCPGLCSVAPFGAEDGSPFQGSGRRKRGGVRRVQGLAPLATYRSPHSGLRKGLSVAPFEAMNRLRLARGYDLPPRSGPRRQSGSCNGSGTNGRASSPCRAAGRFARPMRLRSRFARRSGRGRRGRRCGGAGGAAGGSGRPPRSNRP
jgi:hypothetical protein